MRKQMRYILTLLLVFAAGVVVAFPAGRVFPERVDTWSEVEWGQMTTSERYFYIHGHLAGTYMVYQTVAREVDHGRGLESILQELQVVGNYLQRGGALSLQGTQSYYESGNAGLMMFVPILTTNTHTGRSRL